MFADIVYPPGKRILNRFEVINVLGVGSVSNVYRVVDHALDGQVLALKAMFEEVARKPDELARFRNEVLTARRLVHPNIVSTYDYGLTEDGRYFYTMEYVRGETLHQHIQRGQSQPLPFVEIVAVLIDICQGLAAAHREGVVHCDIKPENVLLDEQGRAKITDFGLALDRVSAQRLYHPETAVGTPFYMAPEQFKGQELDSRADIYALGILAFELAAQQRPFRESDYKKLAEAHFNNPMPNLLEIRDDLPQWFQRFVERCGAKDKNQRFRSALDAANYLRGHLNQGESERYERRKRKTTIHDIKEFLGRISSEPLQAHGIDNVEINIQHETATRSGAAVKSSPEGGVTNLADAHYLLGLHYYEEGQFLLAEKHLNYAAQLDPFNASTPLFLGYVYEALDRVFEAEQQYLRAIKADAYHELAYFNLGKLYRNIGKTKEALVHLGTFLSISKLDPQLEDAAREAERIKAELEESFAQGN